MHLQTLYSCKLTDTLYPVPDLPVVAGERSCDFCDAVRKSGNYPIYDCHFGHTMISTFDLQNENTGMLMLHENSMVDALSMEEGLYTNIDTNDKLTGLVTNFAIGGVDDCGFEHYAVRYPTKKGTRYELSPEEYLVLMVTYALAYASTEYKFSMVLQATEMISKDGVLGIYHEQELVKLCDMHKISAILGAVDFDYERKFHLSTSISVPDCSNEKMILARAYAANTFLEKGAIKGKEN